MLSSFNSEEVADKICVKEINKFIRGENSSKVLLNPFVKLDSQSHN